jgi:hypothetical protein
MSAARSPPRSEPREQPRLSSERDAAQRAFSGVVAEADASIVQKAGEHVDTLERVAERLGDGVVARQLRPLALHPFDQLIDERGNVSATHGQAFVG